MIGLVLFLAMVPRAGVAAAVIAGAALIGFVILVRPSPRWSGRGDGAVALLALVVARAGRERGLAAAAVAALMRPGLAVDAGFALSVLATGALVSLRDGATRCGREVCRRGWRGAGRQRRPRWPVRP